MEERSNFWLKFSGEGVKTGKVISVALLSDKLMEFKKLVDKVVEYSSLVKEDSIKDLYELYFTKMKEGSFMAAVGFKQMPREQRPSTLTFDTKKMRLDPLVVAENRIKEVLAHTELDEDYTFFVENFPEVDQRIDVIKNLKRLCPSETVSFEVEIEHIDTEIISFTTSFTETKEKRFDKWLKKEEPKSPELKGLFIGYKSSESRKTSEFYVDLINGEEATCYYNPDDLQHIIDKLNRFDLIEIKGDYSKEPGTRTKPKIFNTKGVNRNFTLSFDKVGMIEFIQPLELKVSWESGGYILTNEDYNITVAGRKEEEYLEELKFAVEYVKQEYYEEKDENLTYNAQQLKRRLQELFD